MIPKHAQFLDAIHENKLIRIEYQSRPEGNTINCVCAPLDYGPDPDDAGANPLYWIWDDARSAGPNPQGLRDDQITQLHVLRHSFAPEGLPYPPGSRSLPRENTEPSRIPGAPSGAPGAPLFESASLEDIHS